MNRRTLILGLLVMGIVMLGGAAAGVRAHNEYRIIGTVSTVTAKTLAVKQAKDGKTISMEIDKDTEVTLNKKKATLAAVKAGQYVVVEACGDSLKSLVALEIKIVPAPAGK